MRTRLVLGLVGLLLGSVVLPSVSAHQSSGSPATVRIIVAPVTSDGHAVDGFKVKRDPKLAVYCNFADPSPGALSPNIELCSPSAAYAIACWKSAVPHRVLCTQDPSHHKLIRVTRTGKFAKTAIAKPRDLAPLLIVLTDGTRCGIRVGGAGGQPKGHPNLFGAYYCDHHGEAWLRAKGSHRDPHFGIDESSPSWRIRTGENNIVWRHIADAYFVATAS